MRKDLAVNTVLYMYTVVPKQKDEPKNECRTNCYSGPIQNRGQGQKLIGRKNTKNVNSKQQLKSDITHLGGIKWY